MKDTGQVPAPASTAATRQEATTAPASTPSSETGQAGSSRASQAGRGFVRGLRAGAKPAAVTKTSLARDAIASARSGAPAPTASEEASEALGKAAAGAVAGAATGGLAGAAAGAGKAAVAHVATSARGRRGVLIAVLAALAPMLVAMLVSALIWGAMFTGVATLLSGDDAEPNTAQVAAEDSGAPHQNLVVLDEVGRAHQVPWQILAALQTSSAPGSPTTGGTPGGPVDLVVPDGMTCPPTTQAGNEVGLQPTTVLGLRCGVAAWPEASPWGGKQGRGYKSDHPRGLALDAMIPDWSTSAGRDYGWQVARWYAANSATLSVKYIIWDAKIWTGGDTWAPYTHPTRATDPTSLHLDHVHISFTEPGVPGRTPSSGGAAVPPATTTPDPTVPADPADPALTETAAAPAPPATAAAAAGVSPFRLTADSGFPSDRADDLYSAASFVAQRLREAVEPAQPADGLGLGVGTVVNDTGKRMVAHTPESVTDAETQVVDVGRAEAAGRVRTAWVGAIATLPIEGMSEQQAEQVYSVALAWYLGEHSPITTPGGGSICLPPAAASDPSVGDLVSSVLVTVDNGSGGQMTLTPAQVNMARTIIAVGKETGVNGDGLTIALMTALQESRLRNLANPVYPESLLLPNDGLGQDHDSVNAFQQRFASGWGTVAELMDPTYAARAFFGGPSGPNGGSPAGLLDHAGWESMTKGQAAQDVQVSAFPDHYDKWETSATQILAALGDGIIGCAGSPPVGSNEGWVNPLGDGARTTSAYGMRIHPITGRPGMHNGIDWAKPVGTPILSPNAGVVIEVGGSDTARYHPTYQVSGYLVAIDHGGGVVTSYNHMLPERLVSVGQQVAAGQPIGYIGMSGNTTGPHLHFQVLVNGKFVNPATFLAERGVTT